MYAGNLNMTFTIDFSSNPKLYEAFITSTMCLKTKAQGKWSTDPDNKYILTFTWDGDEKILFDGTEEIDRYGVFIPDIY
jgi:hypothetical protein